jgi:hypothetical protein
MRVTIKSVDARQDLEERLLNGDSLSRRIRLWEIEGRAAASKTRP